MDYKPSDIALLAIAMIIPIILVLLLTVPGVLGAAVSFIIARENLFYVCGVGIVIAASLLGFRIFRRIKPAKKKPAPESNSIRAGDRTLDR